MHASRAPPSGESAGLERHRSPRRQDCPVQRKSRDSGALPLLERAQSWLKRCHNSRRTALSRESGDNGAMLPMYLGLPNSRAFGALSRQKIKEIMALNATLDHLDLIDIYRAFHLKTAYYTFSQGHMEHFSEYITY